MVDMAIHQILPAALHYTRSLCDSVSVKKSLGVTCRAEDALIKKLSETSDSLYDRAEALRFAMKNIPAGAEASAMYYHDIIVPGMNHLREDADILEELTDKSYWPYPTYSDLLFY